MKTLSVILIFTNITITLLADDMIETDDWSTGRVTLISGEIIDGKLKYDKENQIVKITYGNSIKAFGPWKVNYFIFYDDDMESLRRFYSVTVKNPNNYERVKFYEAIYEGKETTLFAERNKTTIDNSFVYRQDIYFWGPEEIIVNRDQFFIWKDNTIIKFNSTYRELKELFPKCKKEIKTFINDKGLNLDDRHDLLKIFMYIDERYDKEDTEKIIISKKQQ